MIRLIVTLCVMLMAGPVQAGFAPELDLEALDQVSEALDAPLDPLEEGGEGALLMGRETLGGESARRTETCRQINQAREEGFTRILTNSTAYYADWLAVKCQVLGLLEGAKADGAGTLAADWPIGAPALFSSRIGCIGSWRAVVATLKGDDWSAFETAWRTNFDGAASGPVRFVLHDSEAALNSMDDPAAIGVWAEDDLHLSFRDGALTGRIELLASADLNGDGLDEWIMLHRLEDAESAIDEWRIHVLTDAANGLVLFDPARTVEMVLETCPDQLGSLLADPCLVDADAAQ